MTAPIFVAASVYDTWFMSTKTNWYVKLGFKQWNHVRFRDSIGAGYVLTQCSNTNGISCFLVNSTVLSISSIVDMPVEIIIGFPVLAV